MEQRGYIRLHRCLLENPISKKPVYAWLWTTLLLLANHQPNKFMWNGDIIIIKEGELLTGRKELSLKTGIPETTIEDILKYLERQHQIRQQKTTKFRIITIIEWKKYQSSDIKSDNKPTTSRQQADTNKNDKNDKNDKKHLPQAEKEVFDFQSYLTGMKDSTDNRMRIIRAYWLYKKFTFTNHEQTKRQIRPDLRSATDLACYSDKQIKNTFDYLQNKDFKWTLETTIKYINEYGQ